MTPTFASFLEPAGIIVAAGIITSLIQLIKASFPSLSAHASGAGLAFVFSAVIYVLTGIATSASTLDLGLQVFAAWLACATSAVGVYATVAHVQAQRGAGQS